MDQDIAELLKRMLEGQEASLAKLISQVEYNVASSGEIAARMSSHIRGSYKLGITGAPGVGKSTLVDQLILQARNDKLSVGIIAVDPSSFTSGGALLGDRIRMQQHCLDNGVFIRSMATRGSKGGLSKAVNIVSHLLDAFGRDIIMIETAGVGQTEVDIKNVVDTLIAVLSPECGDSIQLMKAGLLEIADIIVVNKADCGTPDSIIYNVALFMQCYISYRKLGFCLGLLFRTLLNY
jgi:LAO/AO transport system kinase